jgi:hypothetical protein
MNPIIYIIEITSLLFVIENLGSIIIFFSFVEQFIDWPQDF